MRGDWDPAWKRYYVFCPRAHQAYREGRITINCLRVVVEQARKRAYRDQVVR